MMSPPPALDPYAILSVEERRQRALDVRNALLALLRSWEAMHELPRSVPTRLEDRPRTSGGHSKER